MKKKGQMGPGIPGPHPRPSQNNTKRGDLYYHNEENEIFMFNKNLCINLIAINILFE